MWSLRYILAISLLPQSSWPWSLIYPITVEHKPRFLGSVWQLYYVLDLLRDLRAVISMKMRQILVVSSPVMFLDSILHCYKIVSKISLNQEYVYVSFFKSLQNEFFNIHKLTSRWQLEIMPDFELNFQQCGLVLQSATRHGGQYHKKNSSKTKEGLYIIIVSVVVRGLENSRGRFEKKMSLALSDRHQYQIPSALLGTCKDLLILSDHWNLVLPQIYFCNFRFYIFRLEKNSKQYMWKNDFKFSCSGFPCSQMKRLTLQAVFLYTLRFAVD